MKLMKVELHLYASLSKYLPPDAVFKTCLVKIETDTTIKDIIEQMNIDEQSVKLLFLNGVHASVDSVLKDGDRVGIFPPVGGG
jgi:sulfur-carrier protein